MFDPEIELYGEDDQTPIIETSAKLLKHMEQLGYIQKTSDGKGFFITKAGREAYETYKKVVAQERHSNL